MHADTASKPALLSAQGLRYRGGEAWLIDDVSLSLYRADKVVLLGRSGSGKSLLLQALGDMLPLDAGDIRLNGVPIAHIAPSDYRADVMLVHQSPQLSDGSVRQNLQVPFGFRHHQGKCFDADWHVDKLDKLGRTAHFLDKSITQLSGGERQLVSVLRSLQLNPSVALFDEATSALDGDTAAALIQLVNDWHDDTKALLWVTHSPDEQAQLGASAWQMQDGRLMGAM